MKVVYSGAFNKESTNYSQSIELGKITELYQYPCKVIANKVGPTERDSHLIECVYKERPDLVLFAKGTGIDIRVIHECNKITSTCLWFMDAYPHGNWDANLIEKLRHCTFVCCDKEAAIQEGSKYTDNIFKLCEGFDKEVDKPHTVLKDIDVSFIGGIYGNRRNICLAAGANVFTKVYGDKHANIVSRTKININSCTNNCASDRVYKILATKGFLLTDTWHGIEFEDGKHLVVYNGINDLQDKIEYYLEHEEERNLIAEAGYLEVQQYSREFWAKNLIRIYNDTIHKHI